MIVVQTLGHFYVKVYTLYVKIWINYLIFYFEAKLADAVRLVQCLSRFHLCVQLQFHLV